MGFAFVIFFAFVILGIYIYRGYRTRKMFFESLLAFCNHLLTEISFSKNGISSIIETYGSSYHPSFQKSLMHYKHLIDTKRDIADLPFSVRLKDIEKAHVTSFFIELGRHGSIEEVAKIQNKKVFFDGFYNSSCAALKKDASMYLKFCIILGIVAVVLLL